MTGESRPETPLPLRVAAERAQLLLKAVVVPGERTHEGNLIEAVAIPWFEIINLLTKDPNVAFEIPPEKWEEIIAGGYRKAGWDEVTLTPRSGDHGRDVIAVKKAFGTVRVIDQVKAFKATRLVSANDVRALLGVLHADPASKGFVTTTTDFAPRVRTDPFIKPLMPARLELVNGQMLLERLKQLAQSRSGNI
jgi:restriction system protein